MRLDKRHLHWPQPDPVKPWLRGQAALWMCSGQTISQASPSGLRSRVTR